MRALWLGTVARKVFEILGHLNQPWPGHKISRPMNRLHLIELAANYWFTLVKSHTSVESVAAGEANHANGAEWFEHRIV